MNIVILGLSITSAWGNGHATTYRALVRQLAAQGHDVLFLERDVPWYAGQRDLPEPPYGQTRLYDNLETLYSDYAGAVRDADAVIVGSYVPDGVAVGRWALERARGCVAFYDIDTPVTLDKLAAEDYEYISPDLIARYHLYLSFTGGPVLERLEREYGTPRARALYCSVDPELYFPEAGRQTDGMHWGLGYLGTYSADRQPRVSELLMEPARRRPRERFVVAGAQYPDDLAWPANVETIEHIPPAEHRRFYTRQRFTLNVTRDAMIAAGHAPSVRLFEAGACAVPVISDRWPGLETLFEPGRDILIADDAAQVEAYLDMPQAERAAIGERARQRVLDGHTAAHRARELVRYLREASTQTFGATAS